MVLNIVPSSFEAQVLREQSIGEIRGLRQLRKGLTLRLEELRLQEQETAPQPTS